MTVLTGHPVPLVLLAREARTAGRGQGTARNTKAGYTKRFLTSLGAYFLLYAVGLGVGVSFFREGHLWFYIPAAILLAGVGLAAAFRELRA